MGKIYDFGMGKYWLANKINNHIRKMIYKLLHLKNIFKYNCEENEKISTEW